MTSIIGLNCVVMCGIINTHSEQERGLGWGGGVMREQRVEGARWKIGVRMQEYVVSTKQYKCCWSGPSELRSMSLPNLPHVEVFFSFLFFSFISLIADEPHHYHPACGHKGSSHLSPVHALQIFIAMQVQHSYNSSTND